MMVKIRLETDNGSFVADVAIPPFVTMPKVITWGDRVFQLHYEPAKIYRECFAVVALQEWREGL